MNERLPLTSAARDRFAVALPRVAIATWFAMVAATPLAGGVIEFRSKTFTLVAQPANAPAPAAEAPAAAAPAAPDPGAAAPATEAAPAAEPAADGAAKDEAPAAPPPPNDRFEAVAADGSVFKIRLLDGKIPLRTDFGTLLIPIGELRRIEFASRVSEEVANRVKAAVERLGDDDFKAREAATAELQALGPPAYAALTEAAASDDPEVARRAEVLLEQIRRGADQQQLEVRAEDMVQTEKSQIAGKIDLTALQVETALFGPQQLKLEMLRTLSTGSGAEGAGGTVHPNPGTLADYRNQIGRTLYFQVTAPPPGVQQGAVWGTNVYTCDSDLALAAVHAGAIAPRQTKVVAVTILGPQNSFAASNRNGVASGNWGQFPSAFMFGAPRDAAPGGQRFRINR